MIPEEDEVYINVETNYQLVDLRVRYYLAPENLEGWIRFKVLQARSSLKSSLSRGFDNRQR
jgi:hypothetical protein